jgi:hypothetical protein
MAFMYNKGLYFLLDSVGGSWNDVAVTYKCALVTAGYAFNPLHNWFSDITNECTNPGYVAGGLAIAGRTIQEDDPGSQIKCDATDVTFASLGVGTNPAASVIYRATGVPATSQLICYCALIAPPVPDGNNFVIVFGANGVFRVTNL